MLLTPLIFIISESHGLRTSGVVGEVGAEPALGFGYGDFFAGGVVGDLVVGEAAYSEVVGLRMREVVSGD